MIVCLCFGVVICKIGVLFCFLVYIVGLNGYVEEKKGSIIEKFDDCKLKLNICYVCKGDYYVDKCLRYFVMVLSE